MGGVEGFAAGEAELALHAAEALGEEVGVGALADETLAEGAVVEGAVAGFTDHGEDAAGAVGDVFVEPGGEHVAQFEWQAEQDIAGVPGTGAMCGFEDAFQLHIVEGGDHGGCEDGGGDAGVRELADCLEATGGRAGAGFHGAGEHGVERGDGEPDADQVALGEALQEVDILHNSSRLGDDGAGVLEAFEDFEHGAGEAERALDGLVGVGVGAECEGGGLVAGLSELLFEEGGDIGLVDEAGFEIEAGGVAEEGVAGAGVAIDAAVFAAAIGVDRAIEADVRAVVPGDRGAGVIAFEGGGQGRKGEFVAGKEGPAVVRAGGGLVVVTAGGVGYGAAALAGEAWHLWFGRGFCEAGVVEGCEGLGVGVDGMERAVGHRPDPYLFLLGR